MTARSESSDTRILTTLPTTLFVMGCLLMAFEMVMNSARGVGVTTLVVHLITGTILMVILGLPFAYQMHTAGNEMGLLGGVVLWLLIGLFNFGTLVSYWPLRLIIARNESAFLQIHRSLERDSTREVKKRVGGIWIERVTSVNNGNTYFITDGPLGGSEGLVYSPIGNPRGINEWSNIRVGDNWSVIEED